MWDKISNIMQYPFRFDRESMYNEKYLKTKIKSYDGKLNINFQDNGVSKGRSHCICSSVILIDFSFKRAENHYPQVFLEKCKHVIKENKKANLINDELDIFSDNRDEKVSDE